MLSNNQRYWLPFFSTALIATTLLWFATGFEWHNQVNGNGFKYLNSVAFLGKYPLQLSYTPIKVRLPISANDLKNFAKIIVTSPDSEPEPGARSRFYHATRISGLVEKDLPWFIRDETQEIISVELPSAILSNSWRGVELIDDPETGFGEHRDQLIATLAEAGVPISCSIRNGIETFSVRDLLQTSISEFHLDQEEISWTALALILYLPPQSNWKNKFSEEISFDDLAESLMERSLSSESCSGTHLLMVLTQLIIVDREIAILHPDTREMVLEYLRMCIHEAIETQLPDGSWPEKWAPHGFHSEKDEWFSNDNSTSRRIVVSGHLVEWFHMLPSDLKPPHSVVKAGLLWLWSQLNSASSDEISTEFCKFTHAIRALELAMPSSN